MIISQSYERNEGNEVLPQSHDLPSGLVLANAGFAQLSLLACWWHLPGQIHQPKGERN